MATTGLFHAGLIPRIVFTGANAPTTIARFPRGEANHYRDYAIEQGVPPELIIVEPRATNTAQNIEYSRQALDDHQVRVESVLLVSRPYQQRRAFATCRKLWPEIAVFCAPYPLSIDEYVRSIGDVDRVIHMLVGDTQRIGVYADRGSAIPQEMPDEVRYAYERLVRAGFTGRLI